MTYKELVERLRENAEWARGNEWETPLCLADDLTAAADAIERLKNEAEGMRSNWSKSVITIKRLQSELTQEKIDNTNLIGELATVAAERDRYKAERDAAVNDLKYANNFYTECFFCKYETDEGSTRCGKKDCWEWRGLEENT